MEGHHGALAPAGPTPSAVLKCHKRLLPLFAALVCCCYLDRTALAFAALQLCDKEWFDARVYGLGSGLFYVGYVLFQVPSNLVLQHVGAPRWLSIITFAWGIVAMNCAFISGRASFFALRLLLGLAESGAFPALWYICGLFYPRQYITVPYSIIEACIAVSQILAAPLAAGLLQAEGVLGLSGWQWLFIAEGSATALLAIVLFFMLPRSVAAAPWLSDEEKAWLVEELAKPLKGDVELELTRTQQQQQQQQRQQQHLQQGQQPEQQQWQDVASKHDQQQQDRVRLLPSGAADSSAPLHHTLQPDKHEQQQLPPAAATAAATAAAAVAAATAVASRSCWDQIKAVVSTGRIWYLCGVKALKDISLDGLVYWVPTLVHAMLAGTAIPLSGSATGCNADGSKKQCGGQASQLQAVLLTAIPFGLAALTAVALGHLSEKRDERRLHISVPLLVGGAVFVFMPLLLRVSIVAAFVSLTAAVVAADATTGPFWSWVHSAAAPMGASAVALPLVNSIGKAGGFFGPVLIGLLLHATCSYVLPILFIAGVLLGGGAMAYCYWGDAQAAAGYRQLPGALTPVNGSDHDTIHGAANGAANGVIAGGKAQGLELTDMAVGHNPLRRQGLPVTAEDEERL